MLLRGITIIEEQITIDTEQKEEVQPESHPSLGYQTDYLPIPLKHIPVESLAKMKLHLNVDNNYALYANIDGGFKHADQKRLIETGVEYVYVPLEDRQVYYRAMEKSLGAIVSDPNIQDNKKAELLYASSLSVAGQIVEGPITKVGISRSLDLSKAVVQTITSNDSTFCHLMNISNHDFFSATHMVNVSVSLVFLAWKVGITEQATLEKIGVGAILHDIGKIYLPEKFLNKRDKYTSEDIDKAKKHVLLTIKHLVNNGLTDSNVLAVASEHHERIDGSGYPRGLKGGEISFIGKLAAVVDTYEAMTSIRPYRESTFSSEEALQYLRDKSKTKYDPDVVNMFTSIIEKSLSCENSSKEDNVNEDHLEDIYDDQSFVTKSKRLYNRSSFRVMMPVRVVIRDVNNKPILGPPTETVVYNASCGGVGLLNTIPIKPGTDICVSFPVKNSAVQKNIIAKIVRCETQDNGLSIIGARFHMPQSSKFIELLKELW